MSLKTFAVSFSAVVDSFNAKVNVIVPLMTAGTMDNATTALEVVCSDGLQIKKFEIPAADIAAWLAVSGNATKPNYSVDLPIDLSTFGIQITIGAFEKDISGADITVGPNVQILNAKNPDAPTLAKSADTKANNDTLNIGKLSMQGKLVVTLPEISGSESLENLRIFVSKKLGSAAPVMTTSGRSLTAAELEAGFAEIPLYVQSSGITGAGESQDQADLRVTNAQALAGGHLNLNNIAAGTTIRVWATVDNDAGLESAMSSFVFYAPSLRLSAVQLLSVNSGSSPATTQQEIQFNSEDTDSTHFQICYKQGTGSWTKMGSATAIDRTALENTEYKQSVSLSGLTAMTDYLLAVVVNSSSTFSISATTCAPDSNAQATQSLPSNFKKVMLGGSNTPVIDAATFTTIGASPNQVVKTVVAFSNTSSLPSSGRVLIELFKNGSLFKSQNFAQTSAITSRSIDFSLSEIKSSDVFHVTALFYRNMTAVENVFYETPSVKKINNIPIVSFSPVIESSKIYPSVADFASDTPFPLIQEVSQVVVGGVNRFLVMLDNSVAQSKLGSMFTATNIQLSYAAQSASYDDDAAIAVTDNAPAEAYVTANTTSFAAQSLYAVRARFVFGATNGKWSPFVEFITAEAPPPAGASFLSLVFPDLVTAEVDWTSPSTVPISSGIYKDYQVAEFVVDLKDIAGRQLATNKVTLVAGTTTYTSKFSGLSSDTSYTSFVTPIYKQPDFPDVLGQKAATSETYLNGKAIIKQIITTTTDTTVNVKVLIDPGNNLDNVDGVDVFVPYMDGVTKKYIKATSAGADKKEWSTGDLSRDGDFNYDNGSLMVLAIVRGPAGVVYATWP